MMLSRRVRTTAFVVLTGGLALLFRLRRRQVTNGGPPEGGGGLAGVREPRRPLPQGLVGAAAAEPGDSRG